MHEQSMGDRPTLQQTAVSGQQDALLLKADLGQALVFGVAGLPHVEAEHAQQPRQPAEVDVDNEPRIA